MGAKRTDLYCCHCDSFQTFRKARIDHFYHFIISVITLGVWFPIWVMLIMHREFQPWVCRNCRRKYHGMPAARYLEN